MDPYKKLILMTQYGYSLSNSSYVYELLKNHDRLFAIPEGLYGEVGIFY